MHAAFAHPWFLATLVLLSGLGVLAWRERRWRRRALVALGGGLCPSTRAHVGARRWRRVFLVLGLICLGVGAAGPQWGRDWEQAAAPGRDLVVVLDRSRSMLAEQPSRLERARRALLDFAGYLKKHGGGHRLALVVFAAQPKLVCPLTHDYEHFRESVAAIDPDLTDPELTATASSQSGTRIGLALQLAVLAQTGEAAGARDILLLSDGDDPARDGEWREGIAAARLAHIPVFTVGLGDPDQASPVPGLSMATEAPPPRETAARPARTRLEEGPLREIADATGGTYEPARLQVPPIGPLYAPMAASRPVRDENEDALPVPRQHPLCFLAPALFLLVLATALGDRRPGRSST